MRLAGSKSGGENGPGERQWQREKRGRKKRGGNKHKNFIPAN